MEFCDDFFFDLGYFFAFYHMVQLLKQIEYVFLFNFAKNDFFLRFLSGAPFEVILLGFDVFCGAFHQSSGIRTIP